MNGPVVSVLAGLLFVAGAAAAPPAGRLKYDPFDWSALQRASEKPPETAPPAALETPPPAPRLRAVMRGPSGARADLDGVILGIGESASGYRLVEVREYSAVFAKGAATLELEVGERPRQ